MEWRCEWCGKPHAENDPPCDNCGHGEFENAVVPMAPDDGDDDGETMTQWVCAECGNEHPKHTPPCDRCGGGPLEQREVTYDEDAVIDEMLSEGRSGPSADVGYLEVLDAKLVLMMVGVAALVVVLGLGFLGYVNVPGITPAGPVPGNATAAGSLSLAEGESAFVDELNANRAENGVPEVERDENLDAAARDYNQARVRAEYANGDGPDGERLRSNLGDACGDEVKTAPFVVDPGPGSDPATAYESASDLGASLVDSYYEQSDVRDQHVRTDEGLVGVDVHVAPDGRLYVTQVFC